jgi:hypothetical protein
MIMLVVTVEKLAENAFEESSVLGVTLHLGCSRIHYRVYPER